MYTSYTLRRQTYTGKNYLADPKQISPSTFGKYYVNDLAFHNYLYNGYGKGYLFYNYI